ncbi:MAG: putative Na+/H+ antiporter [Verrucomicrobiota bacterium]|nr:putative Na+/H+ antiporter [Verrucomicrobiota bacterium]
MSLFFLLIMLCASPGYAKEEQGNRVEFPKPLNSYADPQGGPWAVIQFRAEADSFNVIATVIFILAIIHTFLAPFMLKLAHKIEHEYQNKIGKLKSEAPDKLSPKHQHGSIRAAVLHFLGEVEAVFGIWIVPLLIAFVYFKGWEPAQDYLNHKVSFTEPLFVVVIMIMASSRPILEFASRTMNLLGGKSVLRWWFTLLTVGPLLGSFITEPGAMTICALLLCKKFYELKPSESLKYATLALLFVNISVGGTLTHFAAPPVLMVASKWGWDTAFMLKEFGGRAVIGIVIVNVVYYLIFRKQFTALQKESIVNNADDEDPNLEPVPIWVIVLHGAAMVWTVLNMHHPVLFIGGLLFFVAFMTATPAYQNNATIRTPLLVGFFLAGLVVHGGLQGWWIQPVLGSLGRVPLLVTSTVLTAFNDNALITYLATLVPNLSDSLKIAVVSGAVCGGGLTVIANAPNPAGQAILSPYFNGGGVNPLKLALAALFPTIVMLLVFGLFH